VVEALEKKVFFGAEKIREKLSAKSVGSKSGFHVATESILHNLKL